MRRIRRPPHTRSPRFPGFHRCEGAAPSGGGSAFAAEIDDLSLAHPSSAPTPVREPCPQTGAAGTAARLASHLTFASIAAMMLISGMTLITLGVPYASAGGNFLTKIHPATLLAAIAALCWAAAEGGLGRWLARIAVKHPGVFAFAVAVVLLFVHVAVVQRLPLSAIVDTFVLPIIVFAALSSMEAGGKRQIERFIHIFVLADAALGIFEYASGWRLTPMRDIDGSIVVDWRSTSLLGHPLNNAFVIGCYLVMLAAGASPWLRALPRLLAMGLAAVSLVAFGGRTGMVFSYVMVSALALLGSTRILAGARFRLGDAAVAVAMVTIFLVAGLMLLDAGAADRLIQRFSDDSGSAGTRVAMFNIFGDLTWEEFLFGPPPVHMMQAQRDFGIKIGIESTEVAFVAFYGLLMTVIVLAGLVAFLAELVRSTSWASLWPIVFFAVTMSAATGLSSKGANLAIFVAMVLTLMPPRRGRDAGRDGTGGRSLR